MNLERLEEIAANLTGKLTKPVGRQDMVEILALARRGLEAGLAPSRDYEIVRNQLERIRVENIALRRACELAREYRNQMRVVLGSQADWQARTVKIREALEDALAAVGMPVEEA